MHIYFSTTKHFRKASRWCLLTFFVCVLRYLCGFTCLHVCGLQVAHLYLGSIIKLKLSGEHWLLILILAEFSYPQVLFTTVWMRIAESWSHSWPLLLPHCWYSGALKEVNSFTPSSWLNLVKIFKLVIIHFRSGHYTLYISEWPIYKLVIIHFNIQIVTGCKNLSLVGNTDI